MPEKYPLPPAGAGAPGKLRYFAAIDDWQAMLSTFSSTRSLLAEARTWLGVGINAGGLARNAWPSGVARLVDRIDQELANQFVRLSPCSQGHTDVGAAGGIAHCYVCGEQQTGETTETACINWELAHLQRLQQALADLEGSQNA